MAEVPDYQSVEDAKLEATQRRSPSRKLTAFTVTGVMASLGAEFSAGETRGVPQSDEWLGIIIILFLAAASHTVAIAIMAFKRRAYRLTPAEIITHALINASSAMLLILSMTQLFRRSPYR